MQAIGPTVRKRIVLWSARIASLASATLLGACSVSDNTATTLTVAMVDNPDMIRLRAMSDLFMREHPTIHLNWVVLEEGVLRQRVATDVATRGGQFDIVTIGPNQAWAWARRHWLESLDDLGPGYQARDLLPPIRQAVSYDGKQYGAPFTGEGSITFYRKDLFRKAGLAMPAKPTWNFIGEAARRLNDPAHGIYGICMRGKPGWGGNMAPIMAIANAYGASFFNRKWRTQFNTTQWHQALRVYVELLHAAGPPGVAANGFGETLRLFAAGRCAIWFDSTVAAPYLSDHRTSMVAAEVGFAPTPDAGFGKSANWLSSWALAVPTSSGDGVAAKAFIAWAASPNYARLVAARFGWAAVPSGARSSLYTNGHYLAVAPFATLTRASILAADPARSSIQGLQYRGIRPAMVPEMQSIGAEVGQYFAAAATGEETVEQALASAQTSTQRQMLTQGFE